ncbi:class I adenylate-forming enzyme family protein [Streptomyces beihaiensis]|uniref:Acyl--CoA ligase n=1 Tax=Streptomyces beihaiensis TaxID=2984495 RepID=A0ABT3TUX1_9ACTN|nr:class I adenylate-forming enzyme family protein [Streptomyces beihaiensis]MCX3060316.1 acyl--CoA ligase [Streptomyces beihaiensis]
MPQTKRPKNIGAHFDHFGDKPGPAWHLDRPFDIAPEAGRTYDSASLAQLVAEMSGRLYEAGLRRGDRLAIIKHNHMDVILLAAAAARIGALPAMITSTFTPDVLGKMMARLEPKVIVAADSVLAAAAEAGVDLAGPATRLVAVEGEQPVSGALPLADLAGSGVPAPDLRPDAEPMLLTHTSGTTGVPKFVMHSADTIGVYGVMETIRIPFLSTRPDDTVASCIAFVHSRAVTWVQAQSVLVPSKVVVLGGCEPDTVVETLSRNRPTTLEACPNIFQRWEQLPKTHPELFTDVRSFISTFDAIHPSTVRTFMAATRRRRPVWAQSWGQSEIGPATLASYSKRKIMRRDGGEPFTNNVGRPVPFVTRLKVVDPETRKPVKRGERGIVLVKTKGLCLGYLGENERHREKVWDGWWNTGDIGVHRRNGTVEVLDREVDVIPGTSGIELESRLLERLEEVTEAIVLGDPDGLPVPVVSTNTGTLDHAAWQRATADLPALAEPRVIDWNDFPRTGTWKVRRFDLRQKILQTQDTHGTGRWT